MAKQDNTLSTKIAQNVLQRIVYEEFARGMLLPYKCELEAKFQVSGSVLSVKLSNAQHNVEKAQQIMLEHIETSLGNMLSPENQIEIEELI